MAQRSLASILVAVAVFIVGGIVAVIGRLIGDAFVPLLLVSIIVGIAAFVIDTVVSWLQPPT